MKKLDLKLGGHPLKNDDFKLIEDSYQECFKSLLYSFDSTGNIILNGVEVSDDGVDVACTEGWVSWLGEIYKVEATTFPYSSGGQLFLKLETTILNPSPTTYKNATIQNVHLDRKLVFKYYVTADIGEYLINFNRFVNLGVPKGTVLDWFGNVSALFDNSGLGVGKMGGYGICNGNTYTVGIVTQTVPDLRGLFVVGATVVPNTGAPLLDPVRGTYNLTDTGGETHHALTEDENATHDHDYYTILNNGGGVGDGLASSHSHGDESIPTATTKPSGLGTAHENRPPYFALIKIIKLV